MPSTGEQLLAGAKQYAQTIKRDLKVPLAQAQLLTATSHRFSDWHELATVCQRSPHDARLRAATLSARSGPGHLLPQVVELATQAGEWLAKETQGAVAQCTRVNAAARGLNAIDELATGAQEALPAHLDWRAVALEPIADFEDTKPEQGPRMNLFDPTAHFVSIAGQAGWGKSTLARSMAWEHVRRGGQVVYVDAWMQAEVAEQLQGACAGVSRSFVRIGATVQTLGDFNLVQEQPGEPIAFLRGLQGALRPFSLLVLDETGLGPMGSPLRAGVQAELLALLRAGVAVITVVQDWTVPTELLGGSALLMDGNWRLVHTKQQLSTFDPGVLAYLVERLHNGGLRRPRRRPESLDARPSPWVGSWNVVRIAPDAPPQGWRMQLERAQVPSGVVWNIPPIEAVRALDGRILAMLTQQEVQVLDFYRAQGRKFDVAISILGPEESPVSTISQAEEDAALRRSNSLVRVFVGDSADAAWAERVQRFDRHL